VNLVAAISGLTTSSATAADSIHGAIPAIVPTTKRLQKQRPMLRRSFQFLTIFAAVK